MHPQNASVRRRDLTNSPPPTITKGKSDSTNNILSTLMDKARALVPQDPKRLFDLTTPYRNNPRYHTGSPVTIPNRGSSLPCSPRGWGGVAFSKSSSMPELPSAPSPAPSDTSDLARRAAAGHIFGLDPDAEEGEGEEEEMPDIWQCKLCGSRDTSRVERGSDSSLSCSRCGNQVEGVEMISQNRAGNCPKEMDKSDVADEVKNHPQPAAGWASGDETPEARRRRLQQVQGGTARMHNRQLTASEMLLGQNAVDDLARRDAEEMCRDDAPDRGRGQLLLKALVTEVFTKLGGNKILHKDVQKHIRLEAIRIYQASVRHQGCCGRTGCLFALSQYNSKALAFGISRHVLTTLASTEASDTSSSSSSSSSSSASPVTTMTSLTGGVGTRRDAERHLEQLKQLEQASKCGRTPQMKILSAVGLISKWKRGAEQCPCDAEWTYQPPSLRNPASVHNYPGEYGKPAQVDPGDCTIKLRKKLQDFANITFATSDLRIAAAHQLDLPRVVQFMAESNMDVDAIAMGLLAATAITMGKPDPTLGVREHAPTTYQVSASVLEDYIKRLQDLVELPLPPQADEISENEEDQEREDEEPDVQSNEQDVLF